MNATNATVNSTQWQVFCEPENPCRVAGDATVSLGQGGETYVLPHQSENSCRRVHQ